MSSFKLPAGLLSFALSLGLGQAEQSPSNGVIVEEVSKQSAGEKAGIQPGDLLASWSRAPAPPANPDIAEGQLQSPFDLTEVEIEQAPRGTLTLTGRRGEQTVTWTPPAGPWGVKARPILDGKALSLYEEGRQLLAQKELEAGTARFKRLAAAGARNPDEAWLASWFLFRSADALADARRWEEVDACYSEAIEKAGQAGRWRAAAHLLRDWGDTFLLKRSDTRGAEERYGRSIAMMEKVAAESLAMAHVVMRLGRIYWDRRDLDAAEGQYRRALGLREKLAPGSLDVAASLNNLGPLSLLRGNLGSAEDYQRRALAIFEKHIPISLPTAMSFSNLGAIADVRGDLAMAETYYRRSLEMREKLAPESLEVAASLNNLALVLKARGDLATAEEHLRRAIEIKEKLAPNSVDLAGSLNNLGNLLSDRRDYLLAEQYYRRALLIHEKAAPDSQRVALSLNNLGTLFRDRGDLPNAELHYRRALDIWQKVVPGSLDVADGLYNLGNLALQRKDFVLAEDYHSRALEISERLAPGSLHAASGLDALGDLNYERGDLDRAESYYRRALEIRERLSPGSSIAAQSAYGLGITYHEARKLQLAADYLSRAMSALENQHTRLGGSQEVRSAFGSRYAHYYGEAIDVLLELGRPEEAFHVLERSRARSFLALLAERDLVFSLDVPVDTAQEKRLTDAEYDRVQAAIEKLDPVRQRDEIERHLTRLRELREKRAEIAARIRRSSPRLASLQYPDPLDVSAAQATLDLGTVLLSYSVSEEKTLLFVLRPSERPNAGTATVSTLRIAVGDKVLREKIEGFRRLIQRHDVESLERLRKQGAELYELLLKPAEPWIAASQRLLIAPDGPLHTLPFGALTRKDSGADSTTKESYLVEWKPLHLAASASVYGELKKERHAARYDVTLAAFGDPTYPSLSQEQAQEVGNPELRAVVRTGFRLSRLPFTREEVQSIARLYGARALKYLDREATEERAKSVGKGVRYLHLAMHGILDQRFPLNSSLAFSIPESPAQGGDNGLLQAWEVFEKVRIDADLVTLSACETALGREMGGEGLLGLTRAFQYAGARSVLASLWSVSDQSTAVLMRRFYELLKAGNTKDTALRLAQSELIGNPNLSHPFHWAGFELFGDWK